MTRQAFIKNTMTTIKDQPANKNQSFTPTWEAHIESYLKVRLLTKKRAQCHSKLFIGFIYICQASPNPASFISATDQ